jgi:hypothetical protein
MTTIQKRIMRHCIMRFLDRREEMSRLDQLAVRKEAGLVLRKEDKLLRGWRAPEDSNL